MSYFTPGPWVISTDTGTIDGELSILGGGKGETGKPYAIAGFMRFDANEEEKKESIANIKLAAAAPEMLNALELALDVLSKNKRYYSVCDIVLAAIRSATK